ncbi:MAG TPA: AMP-binding protein [Candidatus Deferrimicrobium sp.]|nr:AMP-binding protein [Candidatus Deferrimicrobium sp.]
MSIQTRIDTFAGDTIYTAFEKTAQRLPRQVALKAVGGRGHSYTYEEVGAMVRQLAAGLQQSEFASCECVGILSENRPEWGIGYLAIVAAGRTVVPIDASLKEGEIAFIVRDAGLRLIFASGRFEGILRASGRDLTVFIFEENSPHSWQQLCAEASDSKTKPGNGTAMLIYTSGTTGAPKTVELTHENILANLNGIASALIFDEHDTFLSVLPLHHTLEATCGFLTPLLSGSTIVYARSLKSKEIFEDIALNHVTLMCGVPLLFEKMYHSVQREIAVAPWPRRALFRILYFISGLGWRLRQTRGKALFAGLRNKMGMGSIRMFVSGGAALPPRVCRFFNLIGFDFVQGYGMTECSPVISVNRPGDIEFGSVGPPLDNVEVRIDNPDHKGVGEIFVRGANVTPGYRNNPEKTAELIIDGWLHTGDLGRLKNGHLWITGRKKNVIVSAAGKNIYPEELEERLLESPYVLEAVVFGRPKQGRHGEEVRALLVPDLKQAQADGHVCADKADKKRLEEVLGSVVREVNDRVADYKRIAGFDIRLEELEKTSAKKVKRFLYK